MEQPQKTKTYKKNSVSYFLNKILAKEPQSYFLHQFLNSLKQKSIQRKKKLRGRFENIFHYTDENGVPKFDVLAYSSGQFIIHNFFGKPNKLKLEDLLLFNLPELKKNEKIIFVSNEQTASLLNNQSLVATTNPGGAIGKEWNSNFDNVLKGKKVVLIPDSTNYGRLHARWVIKNIQGIVNEVKVVELPNLDRSGSVYNWLRQQDGIEIILDSIKKFSTSAEVFARKVLNEENLRLDKLLKKQLSSEFKPKSSFELEPINLNCPIREIVFENNITQKEPVIFLSDSKLRENPSSRIKISANNSTTLNSGGSSNDAPSIDEIFQKKVDNILKRGSHSKNQLKTSKRDNNYQYYDFENYELLIPEKNNSDQGGNGEILASYSMFCASAKNIIRQVLLERFEDYEITYLLNNPIYQRGFGYSDEDYLPPVNHRNKLCEIIYDNLFLSSSYLLFVQYLSLSINLKKIYFIKYFKDELIKKAWFHFVDQRHGISPLLEDDWISISAFISEVIESGFEDPYSDPTVISDTYNFSPFIDPPINFGLQLVYRQFWNLIGDISGETVKTIPLGPKQVEKVSIKFVRKNIESRSIEASTEKEINKESTDSSKEVMEIINEASASEKWNAGGSFGLNLGIVKFGGGGGGSGENINSSKESKNYLTEKIVKTASKIRNETKAIVSTKKESSFEEEYFSEIINQNEELAITYIYKKLYNKYQVFTKLAEVNSVVFVAEPIPFPSQINIEWIRQYDDIIIQNLLDSSLSEDISYLRNSICESKLLDDVSNTYKEYVDLIFKGDATHPAIIKPFSTLRGNLPDLFKLSQENFAREINRNRELNKVYQQHQLRKKRVIIHIKDNILHYMRAIWRAEDPDVRLRRYSKILVPIKWDSEVEKDNVTIVKPVPGHEVPLSDIINPAGPIGFVGNYSIFNLKNSPRLNELNDALSILRQEYLDFDIEVTKNITMDKSSLRIDSVKSPQGDQVEVEVQEGELKINLYEKGIIKSSISRVIEINSLIQEFGFNFEIENELNTLPKNGVKWTITCNTSSYLEDPELKQLKHEIPLPSSAEEDNIFDQNVLLEMLTYFPDLENYITWENEEKCLPSNWESQVDNRFKKFVRKNYHKYLLYKKYTRNLLVDTKNLVMDLHLGQTSALEEFKQLHRYIDVMKAKFENEKIQIEIQKLEEDINRRKRLLELDKLGDPDIEKIMVIGKEEDIDSLVNISLTEEKE